MVEAPSETIWRLLFIPHVNVSIMPAIEMGLFETLNKSDWPQTGAELARITGGDKLLIVRILRPLAAMHFVIETGFQTYVAGQVSKALAIPGLFKFMHDDASHSCIKVHEFLAQNGFKNPEGLNGPFQYTEKTDLHMFPWLMQYPAKLTNFVTMLKGWKEERVFWFDFFPCRGSHFQGCQNRVRCHAAGGRGWWPWL